MAIFSNLPVYKAAYNLHLEIYHQTHFFSREYKFTLGEKLKNEVLDLMVQVYKANKSRQETRLGYIETARQNIEVIRLLVRVAKDLNVIKNKEYISINENVENISVQLTNWYKYAARAVEKI